MVLIKKGAEANLYLEKWNGFKVIKKQRVKKTYRIENLDIRLRRFRTIHEAQMLHEAKKIGVPTPIVYFLDMPNFTITMEYVEGKLLREFLEKLSDEEMINACKIVGSQIGLLHVNGIIHGDLTTSNMILTDKEKVFFIDFGLSFYSQDLEDKGTDILLLRRAIKSTHYKHANGCLKAIFDGYKSETGNNYSKKVMMKSEEIEKRGRYYLRRL
ncbi:MAG: KEOPS complex kinase/ATPase Bud32 [Candidatus Bathyarchaeia archaeon]